jgi:hypothetical protein
MKWVIEVQDSNIIINTKSENIPFTPYEIKNPVGIKKYSNALISRFIGRDCLSAYSSFHGCSGLPTFDSSINQN